MRWKEGQKHHVEGSGAKAPRDEPQDEEPSLQKPPSWQIGRAGRLGMLACVGA